MSNQENIKREEQLLFVFNNRLDAPNALKGCEEWLSIKGNENDLFFLSHKAEALQNLNRIKECDELIEKCFQIEPKTGDDYFSYTRIYSLKKDFDNAYKFAVDGYKLFDHVICLTFVGWAHIHGKGCNLDRDLGIKYYKMAVERNAPPVANYNLGIELRQIGKEDEAIKQFLISASHGYRSAINILIKLYDVNGYDSKQAFNFLKKLEELKLLENKLYYYLGLAYFYGKNVEKDFKISKKYFEISAKSGHLESQSCLQYFNDNPIFLE